MTLCRVRGSDLNLTCSAQLSTAPVRQEASASVNSGSTLKKKVDRNTFGLITIIECEHGANCRPAFRITTAGAGLAPPNLDNCTTDGEHTDDLLAATTERKSL